MTLPIDLTDVIAAAKRIAPHVRRTPSMPWTRRGKGAFLDGRCVTLKLEHLQVGGSFKARGAVNKLAIAVENGAVREAVTASGGNHGIGVAYAASVLRVPATVFLPSSAPLSSERVVTALGARAVRAGHDWTSSWTAATAYSDEKGGLLVHPFEDPLVIAGQGTVGLELLDDAPDLDALFVAVGGGGLIAGVALAAKARRPGLRVIAVEPTGAPSLKAALDAGAVVELDAVKTIAGTLAPRAIGPTTLAFAQALVDEVVLVSDEEIRAAQRLLWEELRLLVEPAGAAALAALVAGRASVEKHAHVGVLLCGANLSVDGVFGDS